MIKKHFMIFLCIAALTVSCQKEGGDAGDGGVPIERIILSTNTLTMPVGYTETLTASVMPVEATGTVLVWSSSNPECAVVSDAGTVTSIGLGTCTESFTNGAALAVSVTAEMSIIVRGTLQAMTRWKAR